MQMKIEKCLARRRSWSDERTGIFRHVAPRRGQRAAYRGTLARLCEPRYAPESGMRTKQLSIQAAYCPARPGVIAVLCRGTIVSTVLVPPVPQQPPQPNPEVPPAPTPEPVEDPRVPPPVTPPQPPDSPGPSQRPAEPPSQPPAETPVPPGPRPPPVYI